MTRWVSFSPELYDKAKLTDKFYEMKQDEQRGARLFVSLIEKEYGNYIKEYIVTHDDCYSPWIEIILYEKPSDKMMLTHTICDYIWNIFVNAENDEYNGIITCCHNLTW